jgi:hypothetical protein
MAAISSTPSAVKSLWERWSAVPPGLSKDDERLYSYVAVALLPASLGHVYLLFLFAYWGVWPLAVFNVLSILVWTAGIILWRKQRFTAATLLTTTELIVHQTLVIIYIGWGFGTQYVNNVLPKSIAARLKKADLTIADGFQNASILFADLTGFTPVLEAEAR